MHVLFGKPLNHERLEVLDEVLMIEYCTVVHLPKMPIV